MVETMHRLNILDPVDLYRLPAHLQALHLAHVRNDLGGRYTGDIEADGPTTPARPRRKQGASDMMAVFSAIHQHRTAPPSQKALAFARQVAAMPDAPAALLADARATLAAGGEL